MSEFKNFVCWTDEKIKETVIPELGAMATEDSILLDAYEVAWPLRNQSDQTERTTKELAEILKTALDEDESNFILAIRGKSGSGKTFVIKKLHALLPQREDLHVIYVARSSVSIRKVVELVTRDLPGDFAERARADLAVVSVDDTNLQRCEQILMYMGQALDNRDKSAENKERRMLLEGGLGSLIRNRTLLDHLARKGGALYRMAEFARTDHVDGTEIEGASVFTEIDFDCDQAFVSIQESVDSVDEKLAVGLLQVPPRLGQPHYRRVAAELLNETSAQAVARASGMNVPLNEILDEARIELKKLGKKLVLFFEDIALAGGQEGFVYDVLRSYDKKMAPVKAIFAATDGHPVPEQILNVADGKYDVPAIDMRTATGETFGRTLYARLMNLGRIGKVEALKELRSGVDDISSACDVCPHVFDCRVEFGQIGGMGLYPLNEYALKSALMRIQGDRGWVTPRDIVNFVRLSDEFIRSSSLEIEAGRYPTEMVKAKIDPPRLDRSELLSEAEMKFPNSDRVQRLREIYTGTKVHGKILGDAFSVEGGEGGPPPPPPPPPPPGTGEPIKTWRQVENIKWSRGEPELSGPTVSLIRRTLGDLVKRRLMEGDYFLNNSNHFEVMRLRDDLLKDIAFHIRGGYGSRFPDGTLFSRTYEQLESISPLLQAVVWLSEYKNWSIPAIKNGQKFQPSDAIRRNGRRDLEIHIDKCASDIRQLLLADTRKRVSNKLCPLIERLFLEDPSHESLAPREMTKLLINQPNDWTPPVWFGESLIAFLVSDERKTSITNALSEWPISKQGDSGAVHAVDFVELVGIVDEASKNTNIWDGVQGTSKISPIVDERCEELRQILRDIQQESLNYSDLLAIGGGLNRFADEFIVFLQKGSRDIDSPIERISIAKLLRNIDEHELSRLLTRIQKDEVANLSKAEIWDTFRELPQIEEWLDILRKNRLGLAEVSDELNEKLSQASGIDVSAIAKNINSNLIKMTNLFGENSNVDDPKTA
jgi:hypothetical protein